MKKKLVIVESPAKARTLAKILGKDYNLKASVGHVRDLPKSRLGVDVENAFAPKYVTPRGKMKIVQELKQAAKTASAVYLATDPDREGEAISWHLQEVIKTGKTPFKRVVFHEITDAAIKQAFKQPHSIDMKLVNSQQARRIVDRLVGYKLSPLLWRKVRRGLSAGRVQSVAVKIIVDRERDIQRFVAQEYWTIEAELVKQAASHAESFRATLVGLVDGTKPDIPNQEKADEIKDELEEARYRVAKVGTKKVNRQPAPPFITSTLQQEAWRKLRFTAGKTMSIAQQLYEGLAIGDEGHIGLITYMRTDSTRVAQSAITEAREFISARYGAEYLPPHARSFTRVVKGAQEAHEAIRPTKTWREPSLIKPHLTADQFQLYQLIWQRMVASQMAAAIFDNTTVEITAKCPYASTDYLLRASSSVNRFAGFTILYIEERDEDDQEEKKGSLLPRLAKGDKLELLELFPEQHFTQPPPHFTEASLIKILEQEGIGRPSTYAPILYTIQDREYVKKEKGSFHPTDLGIVVNDLLIQHFPTIINIHFTARMEEELDEIAQEDRDWVHTIQDFYHPFEKSLEDASESMVKVKLPDELIEENCPKCGKPLAIKTGRFGKFVACTGYPECKFTKSYQIKTGAKCPECGSDLIEKKNRKKRTFYGCSNYPNCQFATNSKPLPEPCPRCGGLLTAYRTKWAKCTKCDYKSKLEESQPETTAPAESAVAKS